MNYQIVFAHKFGHGPSGKGLDCLSDSCEHVSQAADVGNLHAWLSIYFGV